MPSNRHNERPPCLFPKEKTEEFINENGDKNFFNKTQLNEMCCTYVQIHKDCETPLPTDSFASMKRTITCFFKTNFRGDYVPSG